jgi:hypothetical protein
MTLSAVDAAQSYARTIGVSAEPRESELERRRPSSEIEQEAGIAPASRGDEEAAASGAISVEGVTSARARTNLIALAGSLGVDPDTLLAHVSSGQSIRSLLSGTAEASYGTSITPGGGIAIDQYV